MSSECKWNEAQIVESFDINFYGKTYFQLKVVNTLMLRAKMFYNFRTERTLRKIFRMNHLTWKFWRHSRLLVSRLERTFETTEQVASKPNIDMCVCVCYVNESVVGGVRKSVRDREREKGKSRIWNEDRQNVTI